MNRNQYVFGSLVLIFIVAFLLFVYPGWLASSDDSSQESVVRTSEPAVPDWKLIEDYAKEKQAAADNLFDKRDGEFEDAVYNSKHVAEAVKRAIAPLVGDINNLKNELSQLNDANDSLAAANAKLKKKSFPWTDYNNLKTDNKNLLQENQMLHAKLANCNKDKSGSAPSTYKAPAPTVDKQKSTYVPRDVNITPLGKIKVVISGQLDVTRRGEVWGDGTFNPDTRDWEHRLMENGVAYIDAVEGYDKLLNGVLNSIYLDKWLVKNDISITLIDDDGDEYTFSSSDLTEDSRGNPNLRYSYIKGKFVD